MKFWLPRTYKAQGKLWTLEMWKCLLCDIGPSGRNRLRARLTSQVKAATQSSGPYWLRTEDDIRRSKEGGIRFSSRQTRSIFMSFKLFSIRSTLVRLGLVQSSRMARTLDIVSAIKRLNVRIWHCIHLAVRALPEFDLLEPVGALRIHAAPRRIINRDRPRAFRERFPSAVSDLKTRGHFRFHERLWIHNVFG